MSNVLRILIVEDSEDDALLIVRELRKGGYDIEWERVQNASDLKAAICRREWDCVLSDYRMPHFSGLDALAVLHTSGLDLPFIIVSGAIGEETAVAAMRAGAHDYIMKGKLARLVPAVERELRDVNVRREHKRADDDLRLAAKVFQGSIEGILITDASGKILRVNHAFSRITGYEQGEALGRNPRFLRSGVHDIEFYRQLWGSLAELGYWQGEIQNRRKNGEVYPEWLSISAVPDEHGKITHFVGVFTDLSEKKEAEARIQHLALHDALTDLPNRVLFREQVNQLLQAATVTKRQLALLDLDLKRFSAINDTLGHEVGDQLLQIAGRRLSSCLNSQSIVARLGADEFLAALFDPAGNVNFQCVVEGIIKAFSDPFLIDSHEVYLPFSIGVALFPDDAEKFDDLMKCADSALFYSKQRHSDYEFYHKEMRIVTSARLDMETALRRALDRDQFRLHYQPQVDLRSGKLIGVEALLRWQHPNGTLVSPDQFIDILEETGLIIPVGEWVFFTACYQLLDWQNKGVSPLSMAVNLSPIQFAHKDLFKTIREVVETCGVDSHSLDLEITESSIMQDARLALMTLNKIHEMGIKLSIDDFGTGYSSLSYLKKFPLDTLKIDRSFVTDVPRDHDDKAIIEAIIGVGHSLGLTVLAEGTETQAQVEFLRNKGCDRAQGYFFGIPCSSEHIVKYLSQCELRVTS